MELSQMNLRKRMAYGIACLISYMKHSGIDPFIYKDEIDILAQYTSASNLAQWEIKAKKLIYEKYPHEATWGRIEKFFDNLYWIGASELYGTPSGCNESEVLLNDILSVLHESSIDPPDISLYLLHSLNSSGSVSDCFGNAFVFDWSVIGAEKTVINN